jgi:hypothetical protein
MREARREERIPYDACLQYSVYGDTTGKVYNCVAVDISTSGIGIMSSHSIDIGEFIRFETNGNNASELDAVVQWSAPVGVNYRVGLFLF